MSTRWTWQTLRCTEQRAKRIPIHIFMQSRLSTIFFINIYTKYTKHEIIFRMGLPVRTLARSHIYKIFKLKSFGLRCICFGSAGAGSAKGRCCPCNSSSLLLCAVHSGWEISLRIYFNNAVAGISYRPDKRLHNEIIFFSSLVCTRRKNWTRKKCRVTYIRNARLRCTD